VAFANLSVFCRFCVEVDKFLSSILLIYIVVYELMICVPLYQLVLVSKNPIIFTAIPYRHTIQFARFQLTPWSRALLQKPPSPIVNNFPAFCGTRNFITTCTVAPYLSPSTVTSVHSTPHSLPYVYLRYNTLPVFTIRGSNPGGAKFSATIQTGSGAHPASYTMHTGSFPGLKQPRLRVDHPPHLGRRLKKE